DNEAGGAGFGLNHLENIILSDPGNPTPEEITIFSQFGSINPVFYSRWNYDLGVVGIDDSGPVRVIQTPRLEGNYPNPFNPVTSIRFVLPKAMDLKLEIYNALGQKIVTLFDGKRREGQHIINWNGVDRFGRPVSSGIYFYRLSTENYEKTMKMILMK
ncbi:MAG: T9SS C-terminal target domain-containing protein, partial [Calditrichaeota bacterium]